LIDYTAGNPFDRLPDGGPKVPDDLLELARDLSAEEIWSVLQEKRFNNQFADGFEVLHPGKNHGGVCVYGRVYVKSDRHSIVEFVLRSAGPPRPNNC